MKSIKFTSILVLILLCFQGYSQDKENKRLIKVPEDPVVTQHSIMLGTKQLNYTVNTGYLVLKDETGENEANIFYISYTLDGQSDPTRRPLTFSFNGGPGSSSVWLHLGVLGPKRVITDDEGNPPKAPYGLEDNPYSWLDLTDMVFIDPVSTGYSRAVDEKKAKEYHGYDQDIKTVGEFIRRYINDNKRWASPKYIIGESYGTTRAAGLTEHLIKRHGIFLNGTIMVSAIMNFQTARFTSGNDLPYILFLPTYTATAYYHKKLSNDLLSRPLEPLLDEVEEFAIKEYSTALMKGDDLSVDERQKIIKKLSRYTGLSPKYIDHANLRPVIHKFTKELLRDSLKIVGRLDSRFTEDDMDATETYGSQDPSYTPAIQGSFTTAINDYVTRDLNFSSLLPYEVLTSKVHPWDYKAASNRFLDVSDKLRDAMFMNPDMKVWIANGYYDLATPYFATEYTVSHMHLSPALRSNIRMSYYPAGHMMYIQRSSLKKMREEAEIFYKDSRGK